MIYFNSNLKFLRERSGLSQQQVADYLGMERGAYSYHERNSNESMKHDKIIKLATFFNVSIDELCRIDLTVTEPVNPLPRKCMLYYTYLSKPACVREKINILLGL